MKKDSKRLTKSDCRTSDKKGGGMIQEKIINEIVEIPQLKRGIIWCTVCGKTINFRASNCLRNGWPKCCGYTMTIDSPEERKRLNSPD